MNKTELQIFSFSTSQLLRTFELSKLSEASLDRVTCLTHRYVLLHASKQTDQTHVLTWEDSEVSQEQFNTNIASILS